MKTRPFGGTGQAYLTIVLCACCALFLVSLFKNISYPLFWADESVTVMFGKRVLEYGYPKVHDGKNVVYDLRHPNPVLGLDERTDAFIGGASWGQYYFAALGITLAERTADIYSRTAIIRTTFALAGLAGLVLVGFLGTRFFGSPSSRTAVFALFAFFSLISTPLMLHLREARYYPLTILFVALIVSGYSGRRILQRISYRAYFVLLVAALICLYLTFSPAYVILLAAVALHEGYVVLAHGTRRRSGASADAGYDGSLRTAVLHLLPLAVSLIAVAPLHSFFKVSFISSEMLKFNLLSANMSGREMYLENLSVIWTFFAASGLLYLAIFLKVCLTAVFLMTRKESIAPSDRLKARLSLFLTITFLVYFFAIPKIPNFLFTRYFIALQPILALILIVDLGTVYNLMSSRPVRQPAVNAAFLLLFTGSVLYNISANWEDVKGHVYELTHENRGPLDHIIPYIRDTYKETDRLVIATNYEETSFMYYLNAKVIVGYVGNNLAEDATIDPDIIVYRKTWGNFGDLFNEFLVRQKYARVSFPVVDSPLNNIPELILLPPFRHRFATDECGDEQMKADLYRKL